MSKKKSMTLIELILYIAIVSMFIGSLTVFLWDAVWSKSRKMAQIEVSDNISLFVNKLESEILQSSNISSSSSSNLTVNSDDVARGNSLFRLQNGRIQFGVGSSGSCTYSAPCNLTSNLVNVSSLSFQISEVSPHKVLNYSITATYNSNNNERLEYTGSFSGSLYIR